MTADGDAEGGTKTVLEPKGERGCEDSARRTAPHADRGVGVPKRRRLRLRAPCCLGAGLQGGRRHPRAAATHATATLPRPFVPVRLVVCFNEQGGLCCAGQHMHMTRKALRTLSKRRASRGRGGWSA